MIGDGRRMAMRYPVRTRSTQRTRMGGLTWSLRSNPRPRNATFSFSIPRGPESITDAHPR